MAHGDHNGVPDTRRLVTTTGLGTRTGLGTSIGRGIATGLGTTWTPKTTRGPETQCGPRPRPGQGATMGPKGSVVVRRFSPLEHAASCAARASSINVLLPLKMVSMICYRYDR